MSRRDPLAVLPNACEVLLADIYDLVLLDTADREQARLLATKLLRTADAIVPIVHAAGRIVRDAEREAADAADSQHRSERAKEQRARETTAA